MTRFTILLGGDLNPTPRVTRQVAGTRIIAADAGMGHAQTLGVVPEIWVGDFDSVPGDLPAALAAVERMTFPAEKDKTDGELAVDVALARGASAFVLAGAFGGPRADHEYLHLALAMRLAEAGYAVTLTSGSQEGVPLSAAPRRFDLADGTLFSVLGFSDLEGLTVAGAKWPLHDVRVPFGASLTLSNEVRGGLSVTVRSGRALLLAQLPLDAAS